VKYLSASQERLCSVELGIVLCTFCVSQIFCKGGKKTCFSRGKGGQDDNLLSPRMAADDKNARSSSLLVLYPSANISWCYCVGKITLLKIYREK